MTKPFKVETRIYRDWSVTIYNNPESQGIYAECTSPSGLILCTDICGDKGSAWQAGYKIVETTIKAEKIRRYNALALPLTLALLYVSGWNEYDKWDDEQRFMGRRAWKGYDFDVLDLLSSDGLIQKQYNPKKVKSVVLTPKGIKEAIRLLRDLKLDGAEEFINAVTEQDDLPDESENDKNKAL